MPVRVIKYRCQFKCGTKAKSSEKDALKHEGGCYKNPANKTCVTCSNEVYERDENEYFRGCKIAILEQFFVDMESLLTANCSVVVHKRPLYQCPNWNEAMEQPGIGDYLNEIRPKIELAESYREAARRADHVYDPEPPDGLPF